MIPSRKIDISHRKGKGTSSTQIAIFGGYVNSPKGMWYPLVAPNIAIAGKWTRIEDIFPIQNGDFPASYVSLPGSVAERFGEMIDV